MCVPRLGSGFVELDDVSYLSDAVEEIDQGEWQSQPSPGSGPASGFGIEQK